MLAAALVSCRQHPVLPPLPQRRLANDAELAIYRLLAESTYVRSTGRPVAVVSYSIDSACAGTACAPLAERWGVDSPWWASVADSQRAHLHQVPRSADAPVWVPSASRDRAKAALGMLWSSPRLASARRRAEDSYWAFLRS